MNIKQMDQSNWVCYQFEDGAYYYGQVSYVDQNNQIHPKQSTQMAANPKAKLVKHGFGVYIYSANNSQEGQMSRYQGKWDRDVKHGRGLLRMPDKTHYQGIFKDGLYHQNGKLVWPNGCSYDGGWVKGRMEGSGVFKHSDGFNLQGNFKSNLFVDDNILRNPFLSEKEYILFKKQRKEILKQHQKNEKVKHSYLDKVLSSNSSQILGNIDRSANNNRVPLILSSQQCNTSLKNVLSIFAQNGKKCNILNLRKAHQLGKEQKQAFKKTLKQQVKRTLTNGEFFIINLDQTQQEYSDFFYPDLKEFYDCEGMTPQIWSRSQLSRNQVKSKIIGESELNQDYRVIVWSKIKPNEQIQNKTLKEKIERRFESIIPFIKIDIIFLTKPPHQQQSLAV